MTQECLIDLPAIFREDGYSLKKGVLRDEQIDRLVDSIESVKAGATVRKRGAGVFAMRHLLKEVPEVRELAESPAILNLITPILGTKAFPVRAVLLDKDPDAEWYMTWHQDLSIAVKKRIEVPGFGSWSVRNGILHVQPPIDYLGKMVTIRLHLDDCLEDDGALQVIPHTHDVGLVTKNRLDDLQAKAATGLICPAVRGDVVMMRPLLVHRTSASKREGHSRIIHIEYTAESLPDGLEWAIA